MFSARLKRIAFLKRTAYARQETKNRGSSFPSQFLKKNRGGIVDFLREVKHYSNGMNKVKNFILDILFPRVCVNCNKSLKTGVVCDVCFGQIKIYNSCFCIKCGKRLPDARKTCHPKEPYILATAADYNDTIREMIHVMKYKNITEAAEPLAKIAVEFMKISGLPLKNRIIIPIPLHKFRERARGFNQSALIAEKIAEVFNIPLISDALTRTKNTEPQFQIKTKEEKLKNISGCFDVSEPQKIAGKQIILFDDISTSGATLREAAVTLKKAGAKNIIALVIAKAQSIQFTYIHSDRNACM